MASGHDLGRWGERVAERYLCARGWVVLSRNFRDGPRELDLVMRRDDVTAFVEVKTRTGSTADALRGISRRKRSDLARAAARWIHEHPGGQGFFRFDVVAVQRCPGAATRVKHLADAWRRDSR